MFGKLVEGYEPMLKVGFKGPLKCVFEYYLFLPVLGGGLWFAMYRRGIEFNPESDQCLVRLWGAMNLYSTKGSKVRWSEFLNTVYYFRC